MAVEPKFISKEDVAKLLNPRILLDRLEDALGKMSLGKDGGVEQPMRSAVSVEKHHGCVVKFTQAISSWIISFESWHSKATVDSKETYYSLHSKKVTITLRLCYYYLEACNVAVFRCKLSSPSL